MKRQLLSLCILLLLPLGKAFAQPFPLDSTVLVPREVATDLVLPWDLVWGPEDKIWFTNRHGYLCRVDPDNPVLDTVHYVSETYVSNVENSGLHALGLHPHFPDSPYVYMHYTCDSLEARLTRWRYFPNGDSLGDSLRIIPSMPGARSHNGSRLQWDSDSTFLLSTGDAYLFGVAQDRNSLLGKMLRFRWDGGIPADNPFPGLPVWSYGHRNPQGLVVAPDGKVYSSEHGDNTDDEVNLIERGRNYGWPQVEGFCDRPGEMSFCVDSNVVEPLVHWTPTWAVCGLDYYDHPAIPELRRHLLLATLKASALLSLELNAAGTAITVQDSLTIGELVVPFVFDRLRDVLVAPDGRIFICTSNLEPWGPPASSGNDKIIELKNPLYLTRGERVQGLNALVYPNPSQGAFTLRLKSESPQALEVGLWDLMGERLAKWEHQAREGNNDFAFEWTRKGVYFLVVKGRRGAKTFKVVVN